MSHSVLVRRSVGRSVGRSVARALFVYSCVSVRSDVTVLAQRAAAASSISRSVAVVVEPVDMHNATSHFLSFFVSVLERERDMCLTSCKFTFFLPVGGGGVVVAENCGGSDGGFVGGCDLNAARHNPPRRGGRRERSRKKDGSISLRGGRQAVQQQGGGRRIHEMEKSSRRRRRRRVRKKVVFRLAFRFDQLPTVGRSVGRSGAGERESLFESRNKKHKERGGGRKTTWWICICTVECGSTGCAARLFHAASWMQGMGKAEGTHTRGKTVSSFFIIIIPRRWWCLVVVLKSGTRCWMPSEINWQQPVLCKYWNSSTPTLRRRRRERREKWMTKDDSLFLPLTSRANGNNC